MCIWIERIVHLLRCSLCTHPRRGLLPPTFSLRFLPFFPIKPFLFHWRVFPVLTWGFRDSGCRQCTECKAPWGKFGLFKLKLIKKLNLIITNRILYHSIFYEVKKQLSIFIIARMNMQINKQIIIIICIIQFEYRYFQCKPTLTLMMF